MVHKVSPPLSPRKVTLSIVALALSDDYSGKTVVTKAMGEGAIEGVASDYAVNSPFSTNFKFSRFGANKADPRDVSKLVGAKRATSKPALAGAYNDEA